MLPGDVLLRRKQDGVPDEAIISAVGRGPWIHAAMAAPWDGVWMVMECVQLGGARAVTLASQVAAHPGRWDVFSPSHHVLPVCGPVARGARAKAVQEMRSLAGQRYGWRSLWRLCLRRLPGVRLVWPVSRDDAENGSLPFCSQAVSRAWRRAGIDLVPNLSDAATEPSDLARSSALVYQFTLFP